MYDLYPRTPISVTHLFKFRPKNFMYKKLLDQHNDLYALPQYLYENCMSEDRIAQ